MTRLGLRLWDCLRISDLLSGCELGPLADDTIGTSGGGLASLIEAKADGEAMSGAYPMDRYRVYRWELRQYVEPPILSAQLGYVTRGKAAVCPYENYLTQQRLQVDIARTQSRCSSHHFVIITVPVYYKCSRTKFHRPFRRKTDLWTHGIWANLGVYF